MKKWFNQQRALASGTMTYDIDETPEVLQQFLRDFMADFDNGIYDEIMDEPEPAFDEPSYREDLARAWFNDEYTETLMSTNSHKKIEGWKIKNNEEIAKFIDGTEVQFRVLVQKPGYIFPLHYDKPKHGNEYVEKKAIIFLTDRKPGHVFQMGDDFLKWKPFTQMYSWVLHDIPHGTCNFGYDDRVAIVISWKTDERMDSYQ